MWNQASLERFRNAVGSYDRPETERLCDELIADIEARAEPFPIADAKVIMNLLRRKRFFRAMRRVGDTLLQCGQTAAVVRRLHAQAVIEEGDLTAAVGLLDGLVRDCGNEPAELAEAKGLMGRALKQRYVDTAGRDTPVRRKTLNRAIDAYWSVYGADRSFYWHGINAVACAARAARDKVPVETQVDPNAAADLLAAITAKTPDSVGYWDLATAAEACVALCRWDAALDWYRRYVAEPAVDAFEVASTLRQLREVWQLGEEGEPGGVLAVLKAALLQREGGAIELARREMVPAPEQKAQQKIAFERTFGPDGPRTYRWYTTGQTRARSVGRVEDRFGRPIGSGFLVRAAEFVGGVDKSDGRVLFLTNAHVLGNTSTGALRPADAVVRFETVNDQQVFPVDRLLWESPSESLDATLVTLQGNLTLEPCPLGPPEEPIFIEAESRKFFVIGYPRGGELSLSIDDNLQVGWLKPLLHYRTPTEPGSSGSPVFDDQWRVVALHHAGGHNLQRLDDHPGFYQANEGIWIHEIAQQTRAVTLPSAGASTSPTGEATGAAATKPARSGVFISYSHANKVRLGELQKFLKPRMRDKKLRVWSDMEIKPGARWAEEIASELQRAAVAVLLVSADFLDSAFIAASEFPQILGASQKEGLTVFWISEGHCDYESTPLKDLQAANDPKRPLNTLERPAREKALLEIAKRLAAIIDA